MNASQYSHSKRSPGRQLRWKEFTENKTAFAVGFLIFVVIPSFWTLLLARIDPTTGISPGAATAVWLLVGWLFSAVMGAQVVCRDLGTPLESFLVARPVTELQILRIKAWLGLLLVVMLAVAVGGLELLWWVLRPEHRRGANMEFGGLFLMASTLNVLAYWLAFAAACVTRRALTSMLVSAFVLTLLVTVPLITRLPEWANVTELLLNGSGLIAFMVCFALVLVSGLVAAGAIRFFHTAERRIALGPRQLTWAAALTLVTLFVLAMREVGATQPLVMTWWHSKDYEGRLAGALAVGPNRVAVSTDDGSIRLIDLDEAGQLSRNRRLDPTRAAYMFHPNNLPVWIFDMNGDLAVVRNEVTEYWDDQPLADRVRLTVRRLDWETMETLPTIDLPWPSSLELPRYCHVTDAQSVGSRLFLMSHWSNEEIYGIAIIIYEMTDDRAISIASAMQYIVEVRWPGFFETFTASGGVAEKRIYLVDRSGMRRGPILCFDPQAAVAELQATLRHPGFATEPIAFPMSDRYEFKMIAMPMLGSSAQWPWPVDEDGVIGRLRMSPWAALFRKGNHRLVTAGPGRCIELLTGHATVYDVSIPEKPRRIARYYTPFFSHAEVTGDLVIFNHHLGFSVARLPTVEAN